MGVFVDFLEEAWDVFVDVVNAGLAIAIGPVMGIILSQISDDFKEWYVAALSPVMSIFGIEETDIISVQVIDQPLFGSDEDTRKNVMAQMALYKQRTDASPIESFIKYIFPPKANAKTYYRVAENGDYYNLLPDASISSVRVPMKVLEYVNSEFNVTNAKIRDAFVKNPDKDEWVGYNLARDYQYNKAKETLLYLDHAWDVGTVDYTYVVDDDLGASNVYQVNISRIEVSYIDVETRVETVINDTITVPAFNLTLYYVVQWYTYDKDDYKYWCYDLGSEAYPELDAVANEAKIVTTTTMLPVVELRNNKVTISKENDEEHYKDAEFILSKIGVDITGTIEAIESNPDINNLNSAYIYFGLDMTDTSEVAAKYMFHTFKSLIDNNILADSQLGTYYTSATKSYGNNTFYMTEGSYNTTMIWKEQRFSRKFNPGTAKKVGTYWSEIVESSIYLRYQVTDIQFDEIYIGDIAGTTVIKSEGMAGTTGATLKSGGLIMPLSLDTLEKMTTIDMVELYTKCLRLAVYAAQITHLEWYQTPEFFKLVQIVVIIIAIVLFIITLPAGGQGATAWLAFAKGLLITFAIMYSAKRLMELTDNVYLKMAIAVLAAVATAYVMGGFKFPDISFASASTYVMMTNMFSTMANVYVEAKTEDLQESIQKFTDMFNDAMETLEEHMDKLDKLLSTEEVVNITALTAQPATMNSVDASMYIAKGGVQYRYDLLTSAKVTSLYNWDLAFKVGLA